MKKIEVTMQELWAATRPNKHKNKKKYRRYEFKATSYKCIREERTSI